jgi:hypothetical protein
MNARALEQRVRHLVHLLVHRVVRCAGHLRGSFTSCVSEMWLFELTNICITKERMVVLAPVPGLFSSSIGVLV